MTYRSKGLVVVAVCLGAALIVPTAAAAEAPEATSVVCTSESTMAYSPALTAVPQSVEVTGTGTHTSCVGADGITGATFTMTLSGNLNCVGGTTEGKGEIVWSDGSTSTVVGGTTRAVRPDGSGIAGVDASIESGRFAGASVLTSTVLPVEVITACTTGTSISELRGLGTITIAGT